ncbi:MAG: ribosomal RNA small subunit methyltransferase A [Lentisphaeria bacterium]|nr:ribosomal RNA small subunit methyltransferase A [Lentisphaeria bacterium]
MVKAELKPLLERLGIAPSKRLGQNFLVDDQFRAKILHEADPKPGETILEIGPGLGAITRGLVASGADVTAIEFDRKIAEYLRTAVVPLGLHLIEADACRVKYASLFPGDFRVVSNLPYSAGTIVIAKLLDLELPPADMLLMLQKEVAERFLSGPGTADYSALTVRISAVYEGRIVRMVPPDVFYPEPTVDSALFALKRKPVIPPQNIRIILSRLARTSFAHRRKKMFKQAAAVFGADVIAAAMADASVDPDIRAERVTVDQFIRMAEYIAAHTQDQPETMTDCEADAEKTLDDSSAD